RNASITVSTVSKVLKSLEQELFIEKSKSIISVRDPEKLLDRLAEDYINSTKRKARKPYRFAADNPQNFLKRFFERQIDYVACGFYAAQLKGLAATDQLTIFVKDIEQVRKARECNWIAITPDAEFGNISITEANEPGVWFNTSQQMNKAIVDNIELYLEMMADTPRGPRIAETLKQRILKGEPT
ncbi:MAG: winged helix-turn-helix domain-containing protein, partial [Planctomycetes bacterium]|nr:winged helix-turn-helix domain-containing protein [Planctomycetota bacterium]